VVRARRGLHLIVLALWLASSNAFDVPLRQSLWVHSGRGSRGPAERDALKLAHGQCRGIVGPRRRLLLAAVSEAVCFALNALSFVAVIVAISRMRWAREPGPQAWEGGFWRSGRRLSLRCPLCAARRRCSCWCGAVWTISPYCR